MTKRYEKVMHSFQDWINVCSSLSTGFKKRQAQAMGAKAGNPPFPLFITVEPYKKSVSRQQQRYYWGVVIKNIHAGLKDYDAKYGLFDDDQVSNVMKIAVGYSKEAQMPTGEVVAIGKPLKFKKANMTEVTAYIQECVIWAAQNLDLQIESSEEWKKRIGIKDDDF